MSDRIESKGEQPTRMDGGLPPSHASGDILPPGHVVAGQFEVIRLIGRGGMGAVYEAKNRLTGDRLALKTILSRYTENAKAIERFIREIHVARSLHHPNIVAVYDVGRDGGSLYLTMEFLEGKSLRTLMQERGILPEVTAVRILHQLCDALGYAHQYMVHRDLSPENVMVLPDGTVKLLDFGLARTVEQATITMAGAAIGKAYYMAPEQRRDAAHVDARADIYALGIMLFEMLTGTVPSGLDRLMKLRPDLPAAWDALVAEALAPLDKRLASAAAFRGALDAAMRSADLTERKAGPKPPPLVSAAVPQTPAPRSADNSGKRVVSYLRSRVPRLLVMLPFLALFLEVALRRRPMGSALTLALVGAATVASVLAAYFFWPLIKRLTDKAGAAGAGSKHQAVAQWRLFCLVDLFFFVLFPLLRLVGGTAIAPRAGTGGVSPWIFTGIVGVAWILLFVRRVFLTRRIFGVPSREARVVPPDPQPVRRTARLLLGHAARITVIVLLVWYGATIYGFLQLGDAVRAYQKETGHSPALSNIDLSKRPSGWLGQEFSYNPEMNVIRLRLAPFTRWEAVLSLGPGPVKGKEGAKRRVVPSSSPTQPHWIPRQDPSRAEGNEVKSPRVKGSSRQEPTTMPRCVPGTDENPDQVPYDELRHKSLNRTTVPRYVPRKAER